MMTPTMGIRGSGTALAATLLLTACASTPEGTYYASPVEPATVRMSHILYRAATAAGDDPHRYGFAFIKSATVAAYSDEDATFYFTDGLMRQPDPVVEAVVAHEVAHEVMGHVGTRRKLSLSLTASFGAIGLLVPGAGLFGVRGFIDAGTVWNSGTRLADQRFERGIGGGVFLGVAVVMLNLDIGWPEDGKPRVHFGMGVRF